MRFYKLQLLRFIAASAVIFFHKFECGNKWIDFIAKRGNFAVSIFFVLSGFVITNSLLNKQQTFKQYFCRRALKIYPQWILSMLLFLFFIDGFRLSFFRIFNAALLTQTLYPPYSIDVNFVGWSLSVEMIMYIMLYFVVTRFNILSKKYFYLTTIVWIITQAVFLNILKQNNYQNNLFFIFYNPIWHVNVFLIGISLCSWLKKSEFISPFFKKSYSSIVVSVLFFTVIAILFFVGYKLNVGEFYCNGFLAPLTMVLIYLLVGIEKNEQNLGSQKNKIYDLLGAISFGMYLFHMPVFYILNKYFLVQKSVGHFFIYYAIVIAFSYVSYLVLDKKMHQLIFKN